MEALGGAQCPNRPALEPVVVPSLSFSDHLQRRLADRRGVCMGFEFLTPQDFIHRAVGPGRDSPWLKERLAWKVLSHLEGIAGLPGCGSPREAFALAGLLADRLDQYGHFRPEWIREWGAGGLFGMPHEDWQRRLWRNVREELGIPHPAEELAALANNHEALAALAGKFPRLTVLANGSMDPLLIEVLGVLGKAGGEITMHVVLPSLGFLADLKSRGRVLASDQSPEEVVWESGHPLLVSLGRNAAGTFTLLGHLDENYSDWPTEPTPHESDGNSLLAQLQTDIRANTPPTCGAWENDTSLRVHSCFGRRRELEVLRDEILRAYVEVPGLRPEDIHIVAPNLEDYASLIPTVFFCEDPPLAVRVTEHREILENPFLDALLAVLEMTRRGRFEAEEVLDLLRKPTILDALGCEDADLPRRMIIESGLTRGFEGEGGWVAAMERLLAGHWYGRGSRACYPSREGEAGTAFVLPVADELRAEIALQDRLAGWLLRLAAHCREWQGALPASEWARHLRTAADHLLPGEDAMALQPHLLFLDSLGDTPEVDVGSIGDWLTEAAATNPRRARLSGTISFGEFRHLQNLPCRVLAIVGMDAFPAMDRSPAWNLLRAKPKIWDRNPRTDDRQLFLDALLAPTERLLITAPNRRVRTGKSAPLSPCVEELLRVVQDMGGGRPVIENPLQPFAKNCFSETALPRSFSARNAGIVHALAHEGDIPPFFEEAEAGDAPSACEISVSILEAFWKNPVRAFVKAQGISLPGEEPPDEAYSRAPLELDGLENWQMHEQLFQALVDDRDSLPYTRQRLVVDRLLPPASQGVSAREVVESTLQPLMGAYREHCGELGEWTARRECAWSIFACSRLISDGSELLFVRFGPFQSARHFLKPWLVSLVAAACECPLPTRLLALGEAERTLPAIAHDDAMDILDQLVDGWRLGLRQPLPFAPGTSDAIAKSLSKKNVDEQAALAAGRKEWERLASFGGAAGDGQSEEARLAWRDRDPFAEPIQEAWLDWTRKIALPLLRWRKSP